MEYKYDDLNSVTVYSFYPLTSLSHFLSPCYCFQVFSESRKVDGAPLIGRGGMRMVVVVVVVIVMEVLVLAVVVDPY